MLYPGQTPHNVMRSNKARVRGGNATDTEEREQEWNQLRMLRILGRGD